MDDLSRLCCQNPACEWFGKRGQGNLYVRARYGRDRRRLLCCKRCKARFSETKGTPLFNAKLPACQCLSILEHLQDGCGVRQTARLVKVHRDSVTRLARAAGPHAQQLHEQLVAFSPADAGGAIR